MIKGIEGNEYIIFGMIYSLLIVYIIFSEMMVRHTLSTIYKSKIPLCINY